jgi:hypothetical protein
MSKRYLKFEEWKAEGLKLFGDNMKEWRFVCPICGHVQTPRMFKEAGAEEPGRATSECFGRLLPKGKRGGFSKQHSNPNVKSPCDYSAYGFFKLAPIEVEFADGLKVECFGFDDVNLKGKK